MSGVTLLIILVLLALVVLLLLLALALLARRQPQPSPGPGPQPQPSIPDTLDPGALTKILIPRLAGTPADGSAALPTGTTAPARVIWVDSGDEVLVHLDSMTTQIVGQTVLISVDLETDQTGRTPLIVPFAVSSDDTAGLIAATDEFPRGNGLLAARWGRAVQAAAWSALLSLASDHATERGQAPRGLAIANGHLQLVAGPPLAVK
jgi:hypothetical protein